MAASLCARPEGICDPAPGSPPVQGEQSFNRRNRLSTKRRAGAPLALAALVAGASLVLRAIPQLGLDAGALSALATSPLAVVSDADVEKARTMIDEARYDDAIALLSAIAVGVGAPVPQSSSWNNFSLDVLESIADHGVWP